MKDNKETKTKYLQKKIAINLKEMKDGNPNIKTVQQAIAISYAETNNKFAKKESHKSDVVVKKK